MNRRKFCLVTIMSGISSPLLAQAPGHFVGSLELRALPEGRQMQLLKPFAYVDTAGTTWSAPSEAIVDGASIPPVFWSIVGGPWEGKYRDASVVHDWFCAVRTMPSKQTHRMFYEAMLTSGVESSLARILYLAVRFAGPSWDDLTITNSRILSGNGKKRLYPPRNVYTSGFTSLEESEMARNNILARFSALSNEVESKDMSLKEIDDLVDGSARMESLAARINPREFNP